MQGVNTVSIYAFLAAAAVVVYSPSRYIDTGKPSLPLLIRTATAAAAAAAAVLLLANAAAVRIPLRGRPAILLSVHPCLNIAAVMSCCSAGYRAG